MFPARCNPQFSAVLCSLVDIRDDEHEIGWNGFVGRKREARLARGEDHALIEAGDIRWHHHLCADEVAILVQRDAHFHAPARVTQLRHGLLERADDRLVIMGSGDEAVLRFDGASLPRLADGMTRSFVLVVEGWAKDQDANTAHSQTVEPLPFRGMTGYPYGAGERFPNSEEHLRWRETYNTRPALRPLRALVRGGRVTE